MPPASRGVGEQAEGCLRGGAGRGQPWLPGCPFLSPRGLWPLGCLYLSACPSGLEKLLAPNSPSTVSAY